MTGIIDRSININLCLLGLLFTMVFLVLVFNKSSIKEDLLALFLCCLMFMSMMGLLALLMFFINENSSAFYLVPALGIYLGALTWAEAKKPLNPIYFYVSMFFTWGGLIFLLVKYGTW